MKDFTFFKGYQKDDNRRAVFNKLAIKTFDLSFEDWYQSGYWREKYIPYTLFDGDNAVANVSVNIMNFSVMGESRRYIQLGTVMTEEQYRGQGLSRLLIEKVLEDWKGNCDFVYLFANSSVLGFYPKLGFTAAKQYQYSKKVKDRVDTKIEKLNMDIQEHRDKLYDYAKNTHIYGKLSMQENADLVMFYCISFLKDNVYYLSSLDVIAIVKFEDEKMHLYDVFSKAEHDLESIIVSLSSVEGTDSVVLGFVPNDISSYKVTEVDEKSNDEYLFIQNDKTDLFDEEQIMFPLLSHA